MRLPSLCQARNALKAVIIGGLLLATLGLTGCNALRLGYSNGPTLAWWWIDGYADFDRNQAPTVKAAIDRWFDWHRGSQLPGYAALLAEARTEITADTTADAACAWQQRVGTLLQPALDRGIEDAAALVPLLDERQLQHIEGRQAKSLDEMRRDFLQDDAVDRRKASIKRTVERIERVYGRLGDAQRRVIEAGIDGSPFDPRLWLQERERRQAEVVQTLRRLRADNADAPRRVAALRELAVGSQRSPVPEYRRYQQQLQAYNCAFAARIHNATTPEQRKRAQDTIKGWEDDLRSLVAARNE